MSRARVGCGLGSTSRCHNTRSRRRPRAPAGLEHADGLAQHRCLSPARLMTQFEMTTSTGVGRSGSPRCRPLGNSTFSTPASRWLRRASASISSACPGRTPCRRADPRAEAARRCRRRSPGRGPSRLVQLGKASGLPQPREARTAASGSTLRSWPRPGAAGRLALLLGHTPRPRAAARSPARRRLRPRGRGVRARTSWRITARVFRRLFSHRLLHGPVVGPRGRHRSIVVHQSILCQSFAPSPPERRPMSSGRSITDLTSLRSSVLVAGTVQVFFPVRRIYDNDAEGRRPPPR